MADRLIKSVVLVGMMGCGKTAVGTELARKLGVPFCDSDARVEERAGVSVAEVFARDGEPAFRAAETEAIRHLLSGPPSIVSTGGGAFLSEINRQMISDVGVSLWLDAPLDLLWQRVRHKTTRPLLRTADPKATLAEYYHKRIDFYRMADLRVPTNASYAIADMAEAVRRTLLTRSDVLFQETPTP